MNEALQQRSHLPDAILRGLRATILFVPPDEPDLFSEFNMIDTSAAQAKAIEPGAAEEPLPTGAPSQFSRPKLASPATDGGRSVPLTLPSGAVAPPAAAAVEPRKGPHRAARPLGSHATQDADLSFENTMEDLEGNEGGSLEEHGINGIKTPSKCPSCDVDLPNTHLALEHFKSATHASKMRNCINQRADLPPDVVATLHATILHKPQLERDAFKFLLLERTTPARTQPKRKTDVAEAPPPPDRLTLQKKAKHDAHVDPDQCDDKEMPAPARRTSVEKVSTATALARIEKAKGFVAYSDHNRHDAIWQIDYDIAVHLLEHEEEFECPCHCRLCGVSASNRETASAHLRGSPHMRNLTAEIKRRSAAEQKSLGLEHNTRDSMARGHPGRGRGHSTPRGSWGGRAQLVSGPSSYWRCVNPQCARGFNLFEGADRAICPSCMLDQSVRR